MPYPPYRDDRAPADTPPGAEARLEAYRDALDDAADKLRDARDKELEAEDARDAAKRRAQLSNKCPKVGVFGGVRTTAAKEKAWVEEQIKDEEHAYRRAKVTRQAAQTHLDKVRKQGGFQQSLTASVRETYRNPTSGRQW
jgi:hypothetical protein